MATLPESTIGQPSVASEAPQQSDTSHLLAYRLAPQPARPEAGAGNSTAAADSGHKSVADTVRDSAIDSAIDSGAAVQGHSSDVLSRVDKILDRDVPRLNKAHDLDGARVAYEQAIVLARTLTAGDIAAAQKALVQVRKDIAKEQDPTKLKDLTTREFEQYSIVHLKDATIGNMSLWYYRQGKTEDGNQKFLEAAGVEPGQAERLKKLSAADLQTFGNLLAQQSEPPSILQDQNFYRRLSQIKAAGSPIPKIFDQMIAAAPGDNRQPPANDTKAFEDLARSIGDKTGPITAGQRNVLEAGVKAYDGQNSAAMAAQIAAQAALDKVVPKQQKAALDQSNINIQAQLKKISDANHGTIPDTVKSQIRALVGATSSADLAAASAALAKVSPALAKAIESSLTILPQGAGRQQALLLYQDKDTADGNYIAASTRQMLAHATYAQILKGTGDPADLKRAKEVFNAAANNANPDAAAQVLSQKDVLALARSLQVGDQSTASPPGAAPRADVPPAAAPPAASTNDASLAGPAASVGNNPLTRLSDQDLQTRLQAAENQGVAGLGDAKEIFAERLRRAEDPNLIKTFTTGLQTNLNALESGKNASGKPLDAATRSQMHQDNVAMISILTRPSAIHNEYALYLGDDRLKPDATGKVLADKDLVHAQLTNSLNQIKSMDEQERLAITSADRVDLNLIKRVDSAIQKDRKAGLGDATILDQQKIIMEGGNGPDGNYRSGLMAQRVNLRDRLANLYLAQGIIYSQAEAKDTSQIDELFKPKEAQTLLLEAQKANQDIYGAGAKDLLTEKLLAMGHQMQPDVFKDNAQMLSNQSATGYANMAAMTGAVFGGTLLKLGLAAASEGRINPMLANTVGSVAGGILSHRLAYRLFAGQSESWADSAVQGTAMAMVPMVFEGAGKVMRAPRAVDEVINWRLKAFNGESVLQRTAQDMGGDPTFAKAADLFRKSGLTRQAAQLETFGDRPISSATAAEMSDLSKSLDLNGSRGREAMNKLMPQLNTTGGDAAILKALQDRGMLRAEDLNLQLQARAQRVVDINRRLQEAEGVGQAAGQPLKDNASVSAALNRLKPEAIEDAQVLQELNIKTVGQLKAIAANAESTLNVPNLFPGLASSRASSLASAVDRGNVFGNNQAQGRALLKTMLPDAALGPEVGASGKSYLAKLIGGPKAVVSWAKDVAWDNRFYRVSVGEAGPTMPNINKINPLTASADQLKVATRFTSQLQTIPAAIAGLGVGNSISGAYQDWWKGKNYEDANHKWHKYTLADALVAANFGSSDQTLSDRILTSTIGQGLMLGVLLKGALPQALEGNASWTAGSALATQVGNWARAGGQGLKAAIPYAFYSGTDAKAAHDSVQAGQTWSVYRDTQKPLRNYDADNVGTVADQVNAMPAPASP